MSEDVDIPIDLLGLDVELVKIDSMDNQASPRAADAPAPVEQSNKELSLKDYFQRFVLEHQDHLNETELAKKLGISRKCLWERRQRFNIPRKKKKA